ncbi:uncharacterized protein BP5553_00670 [Venustampulla echinocandica]|uniref:Aminoglycoside phosphotransferase domain-containing protein n=1 Tax=Venustampulla echinocandica TaxID=2656787 RepID=A0A370TYV3_9HELO|nr:uncharacterized protein BP5553_00670 [Venustampulla echinocandica]RDL40691.1 hypothetical protein BP5553_00670 [Venustampulla echinocandica]
MSQMMGILPILLELASELQKQKFSRQLADIYINLKQHSFPELGRLQLSPSGAPEVGPAFFDYDCNGAILPFGPFNNSNDYYTTLIERRIQRIKDGEIATSAPADLYLVYMTLLHHLPSNDSGPFFLRHIDSRDSNFLVDDEYNITGIIDWELATITSKVSAFQSPLLMYDLGRAVSDNELSMIVAQKMHFRVDICIEADPHNRENFVSVFTGWWKAAYGMEIFDWSVWRKEAMIEYGDGGLLEI